MKLFVLAALLAVTASACSGDSDTPTSPSVPSVPSANVPFSTVDVRVGTGAEANTNRVVSVNYAGYLYSATDPENKGSRFDSGTLTNLTVGVGVIPGFSQGLIGMRVGGMRRVIIPPSLAYGAQGRAPSIPGNATLVFDLELLSVQ
jgi:FKBP-type peptidyl-prolyl cis-trans isomerase FkpA